MKLTKTERKALKKLVAAGAVGVVEVKVDEMNCAHCGHDHENAKGDLDPDCCSGEGPDGKPCPCQDFDF